MNFPVSVRDARKRAGLSQADAAKRAGISRVIVNRIENNATDPHLSTVEALCAALGLSLRFELADAKTCCGVSDKGTTQ